MDEVITGSIAFVDDGNDDDDDDDGEDGNGSNNCSIQSVDNVSKPDVRRGILRNTKNNHQNIYADNRPARHQISSPGRSQNPIPDAVPHGEASIFWPDLETMNHQHYYQNPVTQFRDTSDRGRTGSEASCAECWETHETETNAMVRKKHTVRFLQDAGEAAESGQDMYIPSDKFEGQVQCHTEQVQGHSECRRLNIGRIAENKFNDGRNPDYVLDASASTAKTDSSRSGHKWYHFSFRSTKNRDKTDAKVESQSTTVLPSIYAEQRSVDEEVKIRCRGRREMRQTSSYEVNETDTGYEKTLAAQGYRLLSSSTSEPEHLSGYGRWGGSSTQDWNQRVLSTSSNYDLRRSPTVGYDSRRSRGAAVRRSRSTVGDERRRQMMSSPIPESTSFPARRNSADLADYSPPVTTKQFYTVVNDPGTFPATIADDQQARLGWYCGLDGPVNRQLPAATHDVAYYARQNEQRNLSTSVESTHDAAEKSYAGYRTVATTGGEVVWSGHFWTTPRQLRTSITPVEAERNKIMVTSNGETANHEMNSAFSSDVASNYTVRRESFLPVTGPQSLNWTFEQHRNIGRGLPEIRVTPATDCLQDRPKSASLLFPDEQISGNGFTLAWNDCSEWPEVVQLSLPSKQRSHVTPATDERRRRRLQTTEKQPSPATTLGQPRPRDYSAIYAWSAEIPTTNAMKRSATFGDNWNQLRSNADGYVDPARHRGVQMIHQADRQLWPSATADQRQEGPRLFTRTNSSYCGDFVDMRGICRAVVSAADLLQIELFYRSNKTEVISCACAARLYFASVRRHSAILGSGAAPTQPQVSDAMKWHPTTAVGVPVMVLDCGGSRCRDRKLTLVLAEVGSGFALWRDTVDHLTCYRTISHDFHCLRFSHDHSRLAGLRFADSAAAESFSRQLEAVTSGPAGNALLSLSADKRAAKLRDTDVRSSYYASHESTSDRKSGTEALKLRPKLKKCDISGPCCFEHITKFEPVPGFLV